jgi:endoglucanase
LSDDHGKSWKLGGTVAPHTDECQVVELKNGALLLNMRNYWGRDGGQPDKGKRRALAWSKAGGKTWSDLHFDRTLIEPMCQASFLRYSWPGKDGKSRLLFSNPASTDKRHQLTVRLSYDEGKTWSFSKRVYAGSAAYSCLAVLPDRRIGLLYERDNYKRISFKAFTLAWLTGNKAKPVAAIFAANKQLGRGINLGNALDAPKEGEWGVTLRPAYFKAIKAAGFATVRLPVRWSGHALTRAPYTIDAKFARRVDWAVKQALDNKLNIIINIHHYGEMDTDPEKHLPRLLRLWEQIAARYKDQPAGLYFELLNEPHEKLTEVRWNAIIPKVLALVRKTNPTRPVIIGPGQWNSIGALDKLKLPADKNLILTVHYYDPFHFTHQGASWVKGANQWKGQKWSGTAAEKAAIRKSLERAAAWAKTHNRPVFLGEFGAYQEADMPSRARWTRCIVSEAERLGFSWAYWEFCSGFGAYDPKAGAWREALKAALVP